MILIGSRDVSKVQLKYTIEFDEYELTQIMVALGHKLSHDTLHRVDTSRPLEKLFIGIRSIFLTEEGNARG